MFVRASACIFVCASPCCQLQMGSEMHHNGLILCGVANDSSRDL